MSPPTRQPLRVALTGGIATGKSTVVKCLQRHGVPVVDADVLARAVVDAGSPALGEIVTHFGQGVLTAQGTLDRRALAALVFADANERQALEAIVHPRVRRAIDAWFDALAEQGQPLGVADIPLLFETGRQRDFDYVVVVACTASTQRARLMVRDRLTEDEANRRLAAQWPIERKAMLGNEVVRTDGTLTDTERRSAALAAHLLALARAPQPSQGRTSSASSDAE